MLFTAATSAAASATSHPGRVPLSRLVCYQHRAPLICLVAWWRRDTWRLQTLLARAHTATRHAELRTHNPAYRLWIKHVWKHRARRLDQVWPPWTSTWLADAMCVHRFEGAWNEPGGLGPDVSGGLQIGRYEWRHFGGAYWTDEAYQAEPAHQLLVAYRYWRLSGWHPWPNTAAACGLL